MRKKKKNLPKNLSHIINTYGKDSPEYVIYKKRRRLRDINDIVDFLERLVGLVILLFVLFGLIFGLNIVSNDDMKPRLSSGDIMLYYRLNGHYQNDDVIVLKKDQTYVGRIIAQGGDTVDLNTLGNLKVNGNTIEEPNIFTPTKPYQNGATFPIKLKKDEVFVLCDNREGSKDSRYYGAVKLSEVKGKVIGVLRRNSI